MSASWLQKIFNRIDYKIFICVIIFLLVQIYLGYILNNSDFYAHYGSSRLPVEERQVDFQAIRQAAYTKNYYHKLLKGYDNNNNDAISQHQIASNNNNNNDLFLTTWDPESQRRTVVDKLYAKENVPCEKPANSDAISSFFRAKTVGCRSAIQKASCLLQQNKLFPSALPRHCPLKGKSRGEYLGCYKDDPLDRDLSGPRHKSVENSPEYCTNLCLASGYNYAGVQYSQECWCGNSFGKLGKSAEGSCDHACPSNSSLVCGGFKVNGIYNTGYGTRPAGTQLEAVAPKVLDVETSHMVRILFMFTWNGRAWRQVKRLFKQLYHVNHYYYIHVDSREEYLYRKALTLTHKYDNVRVISTRTATIWGGSSLLEMLLHTMKEALNMSDWTWDFYLNLSESDYPVKSLESLTAFLTANKGKNFVKSHGPDTPTFIRKQGLLRTFFECDYHLWRVGNRTVPTGIRIDGGSDWICLSRKFVDYATNSEDELVQGLKQYYAYALLPAESYFHTVLQNSEHCESFIDNNLHKTNWNRKRGCLCQYKHIVDWCGCSPMDFTHSDSDRTKLEKTAEMHTYFARKFEGVVNSQIVNWVDEWLLSPYPSGTKGLTSYWQNVFHHQDSWKRADDSQYTFYMSFARNTVNKLVKVNQAEECSLDVKVIEQVHVLNEMDKMDSLLVQLVGQHKKGARGADVKWEVQVKPKPNFILIKPFGAISRILDLKVGGTFDVKERLYRDYGQLMSSNTPNVTVVQQWQGGLAVNVTLVVTNPVGAVEFIRNITVPQGMDNIVVTKVRLRKPMLPGRWAANLIYQNVLVAKTSYLVVPELYVHRSVVEKLTTPYDYEPASLPVSSDLVKTYQEILTTDENADHMSLDELKRLLQGNVKLLISWVDEWVGSFWKPTAVCSVHKDLCDLVPFCNETSWSSWSPDPKSELGDINPRTGKISQLIGEN